MKDEVIIEGAREGDLPRVLAVLEDAAAWLVSRGIDQWRPGAFHPGELLESIRRGELYIVRIHGVDAATIILQWSDPLFWPAENQDDAGYVHKLAVRREWAGRGIGSGLLDWAGERAAGRGRKFIRLDCMGTNPGLCRYYERLGFVLRDRKAIGTWEAALYERTIELPRC